MHRQQGLKTSHLWLSAPQKITWLTRRRDATKINVHVPLFTHLIDYSSIDTINHVRIRYRSSQRAHFTFWSCSRRPPGRHE
jgi:hypothetical protein